MSAAPPLWCVRLVRARWVLSVDGQDLASSGSLSNLEHLTDLAGGSAVHLPAEFSSWDEDRALTDELRCAVAAHVGVPTGPGSAGLGWLTGWLAAGYPDVAREALASIQRDQARSAPSERPARPGELCTCGRPATVVFLTERFGEVGQCGLSSVDPLLPCPFCAAEEPHWEPWGDTARCPAYRLRPETEGGAR